MKFSTRKALDWIKSASQSKLVSNAADAVKTGSGIYDIAKALTLLLRINLVLLVLFLSSCSYHVFFCG